MTHAPRPDFNYLLVNSSDLPGMTHAGFTALAHQVWNSFDLGALLQQHVVQGNASSVVVTGHSLGAGVATVLSLLVQLHLANETNVSAVASTAYPSLGAATNATNAPLPLNTNDTNAPNATLPLAPNATNATSAINATLAAVNATNATSLLANTTNTTNVTGANPVPANATGSTSPAAAGTINATNATFLPGNATNATSSNATNAIAANATARRVIVHALLFASPSSGDQVFVEQLSRRVNVRNVRLIDDAVPQLPCTPQIACNDPSEGAWAYVTTSGVVNLTAADMALQRKVWAKLNTLELARFQAFNLAAHGCGYMCR